MDGDDCSLQLMNFTCDPKCGLRGCTGPTASDCSDCCDHSTRNMYGACVCDYGWTGNSCNSYRAVGQDRYNDICSPKCRGCNGPDAGDCVQCVPGAKRDKYNVCVCAETRTGDDCSVSTTDYGGECSPKCLVGYGCTGPTAKDCVRCVNNSVQNASGECVCVNYFSGEDCLKRYDSMNSGFQDSSYPTYNASATGGYGYSADRGDYPM
jgi:hypothetical protein